MGEPNGAFQFGVRGHNFSAIRDGLSNTILAGEKHVPQTRFGYGMWDSSTYNGDYPLASSRPAGPDFPLARSPDDLGLTFGSYHTAVCQFVMGDSRIVGLSHTIDPAVLGLLANRHDRQVIPDY